MATIVNAGVLGIRVGDEEYATAAGATYSTQVKKAESIPLTNGRGRKSSPVVPYIEVEVYLAEGQALADLETIRDETVILRLEDRTVTLSEADYVGDASSDGAENKVKAKFEGSKCVEVMS